ncbi:MAG: CotH kinase family protein, partial [Acutalibacteraceae bacterium]
MSTHKHFDKICCVVLALTLILSVLFMNAEHFGVQKASTVMGYESTLFDTSKVHTIDIIMDDWDEFTANCKSEEYYACTVVIDNEAYKNVAIRGKGNTSLSQVTNDRYSYKIEFDHYDSTNTYYGLDKLCLNNIIQDNTYMKDYLTYQMMNEMGVASPLCSYVYITVNGEDWGLYLAVEGVEESFLQRNYGKDYGELYKPDSMSMGGGRGNGEKFDIDEFLEKSESENTDTTDNIQNGNNNNAFPQMPGGTTSDDTGSVNQMPGGNMQGGQIPNGNQSEMPGGMQGGQMPDGMTPPTSDGNTDFGGQMPD